MFTICVGHGQVIEPLRAHIPWTRTGALVVRNAKGDEFFALRNIVAVR
jgi:hypothetical protein